MTILQVGRILLEVAPTQWDIGSDGSLQIAFTVRASSVEAAVQMRDQILGLGNNPDELAIPVVWVTDPDASGWYVVVSSSANVTPTSYSTTWFSMSLVLDRVQAGGWMMWQSRVQAAIRANDYTLDVFDGQPFHAIPAAAVEAQWPIFEQPLSSGVTLDVADDTRASETGDVVCRFGTGAFTIPATSARWQQTFTPSVGPYDFTGTPLVVKWRVNGTEHDLTFTLDYTSNPLAWWDDLKTALEAVAPVVVSALGEGITTTGTGASTEVVLLDPGTGDPFSITGGVSHAGTDAIPETEPIYWGLSEWTVNPEDHYIGACRLQSGPDLSTLMVVVGRDLRHGHTWLIDNGLVAVFQDSGVLQVATWDGSAWQTTAWSIADTDSTVFTVTDVASCLRNSPEAVSVRVSLQRAGSVRSTDYVDVTVRRGDRVADFSGRSLVATDWTVKTVSTAAGTQTGPVIAANTAVSGVKALLVSSVDLTQDSSHVAGTPTDATLSFDFGLGGSLGSGDNEAPADLGAQWMAAGSESPMLVRR